MDPSSSHKSAPNEPDHRRGSSLADFKAYIASLPPTQRWTTDGYPIVNGKYFNLDTGEVTVHIGTYELGPPNITVYWQNRFDTGQVNQFLVTSSTIHSTRNLSEYHIRIGNLLRSGVCKVDSLNATPYSVYDVVTSEVSQKECSGAFEEHGLRCIKHRVTRGSRRSPRELNLDYYHKLTSHLVYRPPLCKGPLYSSMYAGSSRSNECTNPLA